MCPHHSRVSLGQKEIVPLPQHLLQLSTLVIRVDVTLSYSLFLMGTTMKSSFPCLTFVPLPPDQHACVPV